MTMMQQVSSQPTAALQGPTQIGMPSQSQCDWQYNQFYGGPPQQNMENSNGMTMMQQVSSQPTAALQGPTQIRMPPQSQSAAANEGDCQQATQLTYDSVYKNIKNGFNTWDLSYKDRKDLKPLAAAFTTAFIDGTEIKQKENWEERVVAKNEKYATFPVVKYTEIFAPSEYKYDSTMVYVVNMDTLNLMMELKKKGAKKVCGMVMASPDTPGGVYKIKPIFSQEENIFVRTGISQVIHDRCFYLDVGGADGTAKGPSIEKLDSCYPLADGSCLYAKDVKILRGDDASGYKFLSNDERYDVDFVMVPGVNMKKVSESEQGVFTSRYALMMRAKISVALAACVHNGASVLVLSALGCGTFKNSPEHIAAIFEAVIQQYAGCFEEIYFGIYDSENSKVKNCLTFSKYIIKNPANAVHCLKPQTTLPTNLSYQVFYPCYEKPPKPMSLKKGYKQEEEPSTEKSEANNEAAATGSTEGSYQLTKSDAKLQVNVNEKKSHGQQLSASTSQGTITKCQQQLGRTESCQGFEIENEQNDEQMPPPIPPSQNHKNSMLNSKFKQPTCITSTSSFSNSFCSSPSPAPGGSPTPTPTDLGQSSSVQQNTGSQGTREKIAEHICGDGGLCKSLEQGHFTNYVHPPFCYAGDKCTDYRKMHRFMFFHRNQCPDPECSRTLWGGNTNFKQDDEHLEHFFHPPKCQTIDCKDMDPEHRHKYLHRPPEIKKCEGKQSHIDDKKHYFKYRHVLKCSHENNCESTSELHFMVYHNTKKERQLCKWTCERTDHNHWMKYCHMPIGLPISPVNGHNIRNYGVDTKDYFDFRSTKEYYEDFPKNTSEWLSHFKGNWDPKEEVVKDVMTWVEQLRPVHMCGFDVLKSIIYQGKLMSMTALSHFWHKGDEIVEVVYKNNEERLQKYSCSDFVKKRMIKGMISKVISKMKSESISAISKDIMSEDETKALNDKLMCWNKLCDHYPYDKFNYKQNDAAVFNNNDAENDSTKKELKDDIKMLCSSIHNVLYKPPGIGCQVDKKLGIDHTVFGVLGPHNFMYGNGEVYVIFRKALMDHPDFFMYNCAATFYDYDQKRKVGKQHLCIHDENGVCKACAGIDNPDSTPKIYLKRCFVNRQPWMEEKEEKEKEKDHYKKEYVLERFHPMDPRWSLALAKDLICRTCVYKNWPKTEGNYDGLDKITLKDVKDFWAQNNPHALVETHLPAVVPLDYVERIVIGKSGISDSEKKKLRERLGSVKVIFADDVRDARNIVFSYFETPVPGFDPIFFRETEPKVWPTVQKNVKPYRPNKGSLSYVQPHCGMSFTLTNQTVQEVFIPATLDENMSDMYIYFIASGSDFFFTLTNAGNLKQGNDERKSITFWMGNTNEVALYRDDPTKAKLSSGDQDANFNREAKVSNCVFYVLHAHRDEDDNGSPTLMLTLTHWGPSAFHSEAKFVVKDNVDPNIKYFSFSVPDCDTRPEYPTIMNLFVSSNSPPDSMELQKKGLTYLRCTKEREVQQPATSKKGKELANTA